MFNYPPLLRVCPSLALLMLTVGASSCRAQVTPAEITVSTIAELRGVATNSNQRVALKPGEYWMGKNGKNPVFLDLSGSNSSFVFTGCHIKVDSRDLKGFGSGHENKVRLLQLSGANVSVDGLQLSTEIVDKAEGFADMYTNAVEIVGSGDTLKNCDITTRGSRVYGFGDAFGKGSRPSNGNVDGGVPFRLHSKHNGLRIAGGAGNVTLDNVRVHMRAFGHGIYFQEAAHDITVKNCVVEGDEMASSNDVIADPLYQKYGVATYGEKVPAGIRLSKSEDGIRVYGASGTYGFVKNVRIENTKVFRMRDGYALGDMEGELTIKNCEAWNCETGFTPAKGGATIENCRGDAVNGPLLFFRRGGTNVMAQVDLAGKESPENVWPIAIISGQNNSVTLTRSSQALYPENAFVLVSQAWREWRHHPAVNIDTERGIGTTTATTIDNQTGQKLLVGTKASKNNIVSNAGAIDKGQNNTIKAPTWNASPLRIQDTWGEYQVYPALQP